MKGSRMKGKDSTNNLRNVFIISIDALRADHLGFMGYNKNVSPNIDQLANEGTVFKKALAPGSYTFLSFPSISTSLYPSEFFIRNGKAQTIAGVLKNYGYKTVSFNSNPHSKGKLDRDFDFFEDLVGHSEFDRPRERLKRKITKTIGGKNLLIRQLGKILTRFSSNVAKPYADAEKMNEKAIKYLKSNCKTPLFFWMHYMDPHYPYSPPDRFTDLSKKDIARLNRLCWRSLSKNKKSSREELLTTDDKNKLINLYDGEIKYVDECVGQFLNRLREMDLYENSMILLFSDHGEMLGEHGMYSHEEYHLYNNQLQVPFIFKGLFNSKRNVDYPVTIRDIAPTIMDSLDLGFSAFNKGHLTKKKRKYIITEGFKPQDVVSDSEFNIQKINISCQLDHWKFIYKQVENKQELYNLKNDPTEENNLIGEEKEIAYELLGIVNKHKDRISKTNTVKKDMQNAIKRIKI